MAYIVSDCMCNEPDNNENFRYDGHQQSSHLPAEKCRRGFRSCKDHKPGENTNYITKMEEILGTIPWQHELDKTERARARMDLKAAKNQALYRTQFGVITGKQNDLNHQRNRALLLRQKLDEENYKIERQIAEKFEAKKEDRLQAMRDRVKELKEKRESQERQFVEKKMDWVFETQCDEMRSLLSDRLTKEVSNDLQDQIKLKQRLKCEEEENEKMWHYIALQDAANKEKREEAYRCLQERRTKAAVLELDAQIAEKKARGVNDRDVEEKELAINRRAAEMLFEEEKQRELEKAEISKGAKARLDDMIATRDSYRDRRLKREELVELEYLKNAIREIFVEKEGKSKKKKELFTSISTYKDYVKAQAQFEHKREQNLEELLQTAIEDQYNKVTESRRKEKEQRRRLFCNVMAGRKLQIQDIEDAKRREELERKKEMEMLKEDVAKYLQELRTEKIEKHNKQLQYRSDLQNQIQYLKQLKERERKEEERETELCGMEEAFLQNRLQTVLKQATHGNGNPMRERYAGKPVGQCLRPLQKH